MRRAGDVRSDAQRQYETAMREALIPSGSHRFRFALLPPKRSLALLLGKVAGGNLRGRLREAEPRRRQGGGISPKSTQIDLSVYRARGGLGCCCEEEED
ncbi:hypothetical protein GUJ93_ZPchr0002g23883 [Zizania palustris]|uniref:Uncharacterized protein n=1 Tax=Zizania palustris TaxID=103762 RepID=A0A8J5VBP4_ZIZPA|nr:hypothetical protein GUJ93_ZPchr0002g23883 [Zizania palustris]